MIRDLPAPDSLESLTNRQCAFLGEFSKIITRYPEQMQAEVTLRHVAAAYQWSFLPFRRRSRDRKPLISILSSAAVHASE